VEDLIHQVLAGLIKGSYYWLIAAGLSIAFGVLGILNIAHGCLYMLGGYVAFTLYHSLEFNFALAVVLAVITVGGVGFVLERFVIRRVYGRPLEIQLILTFALMYVIWDLTFIIWGPAGTIPTMPALFQGSVPVMGRAFPIYNIVLIGAAVAVFFVIRRILAGTWWGRTIRAAASDREMANAVGINIRTLFATAFVFASAIAAFGGAMYVPVKMFIPSMGADLIIPAFVVVAVGSLGSLEGAFVAAILIGVVSSLGTLYLPVMEVFAMYLIMAVVLIIRPQGLFGRAR